MLRPCILWSYDICEQSPVGGACVPHLSFAVQHALVEVCLVLIREPRLFLLDRFFLTFVCPLHITQAV